MINLIQFSKNLCLLVLCLLIISCEGENNKTLENVDAPALSKNTYHLAQGLWLGKLNISENKSIPFNLEIIEDSVYFLNAEERIGSVIEKIEDQYKIKMPIFDSEFHFSKTEGGLFGFWHNKAKGENYKIDFSAEQNSGTINDRFTVKGKKSDVNLDGKWETIFSPGTDDKYSATGLFNQNDENVSGTFITETGDYRFLQGNVYGDSLFLSCFDGSHAFLFEAKLENDSLNGMFYSGSHHQEPWVATINDDFKLADPYSISRVVDNQEIQFSLPNLDGKTMSYPDPRYSDKVVIIQILGSWCPNCMDETRFLTDLHDSYAERGLEVIGLAFENPTTLEGKIERVKDLKAHFNSKYEFLIAGDASKKKAEELLPFLDKIMSFPTTIYIDRDGVIRKVHTGFYGPGTGQYYLEYVNHIQAFVQKLLNE